MKTNLLITALLTACLTSYTSTAQTSQPKDEKKASLVITPLTGNFYIYTTYHMYSGTLFPSNSMYLVTNDGVVLFDTPWDTTQFQPLLDSIGRRHHQKVVVCIATHFHDDRTAGLAYYQSKGISTYTSRQTYDLTPAAQRPEFVFTRDTSFHMGNYSFQTYYPGKGHSPDNIVIWFPKEKIIYGGCFVKSTESKDLGNLSDASVSEWPQSVRNVLKKCAGAQYVIPGHFGWSDRRSLEHTLKLLKTAVSKGQ